MIVIVIPLSRWREYKLSGREIELCELSEKDFEEINEGCKIIKNMEKMKGNNIGKWVEKILLKFKK